jgi:hypothetical protein
MPRKQRFKPSRKPKPDQPAVAPTNTQQTSAVDESQATRSEERDATVIEPSAIDDQRA